MLNHRDVEPIHKATRPTRTRSAMLFVVACARRALSRISVRSAVSKAAQDPQADATKLNISKSDSVAESREISGQISIEAAGKIPALRNLRLTDYDSATKAGVENLRIRSQVLRGID